MHSARMANSMGAVIERLNKNYNEMTEAEANIMLDTEGRPGKV